MTKTLSPLAHLSDDELLVEVRRLAERERHATAQLIASLAELDARRLYLGQGCSSHFTYCTQVLRLSEHAAYGRIEAARAARRFPVVLELLANGLINLTAIGLLAPHLTPENHRELLDSARHKSKREVEHLVACLSPRASVPSTVRKLSSPKPPEVVRVDPDVVRNDAAGSSAPCIASPPNRPAVVGPLAPDRYKVQFTVSRETYEKLRRAQDLLRHTSPSGDPAAIVDRALTLLLADLEKTKLAATERPRATRASAPGSRHIPAAGPAGRLGSRWWTMRLRGHERPLHGTRLPGIPPRRAVRRRGRGRDRQYSTSVQGAQCLRGRAVLRAVAVARGRCALGSLELGPDRVESDERMPAPRRLWSARTSGCGWTCAASRA